MSEPKEQCPKCEGKGWVWEAYRVTFDEADQEKVECIECGGTGEVDHA